MITELRLPVTHCRAKNDAILAGWTDVARCADTTKTARWTPAFTGVAESIVPRPLGEIKVGRSDYIALRRN